MSSIENMLATAGVGFGTGFERKWRDCLCGQEEVSQIQVEDSGNLIQVLRGGRAGRLWLWLGKGR